MTGAVRVFVNGRGLDLPAGATVRDALLAADPGFAAPLAAGTLRVTDARDLPVEPGAWLVAGGILRARVAARRGGGADAHA